MPPKPIHLKKAYNNVDFLNSPAARTIRIMTEMIEPADRLRRERIHNTVVFFGSARTPSLREANKAVRELKKKIKSRRKPSPQLLSDYEHAQRQVIMARSYEDAVDLSSRLTKWFMQPKNADQNFVICSGGGPGIMEAANKGAKKARGRSIGLNINLPMEQSPNVFQTQELAFDFHYFFIRKFWFFYLAKGLVIFPGGFGTLDEFFELLTIVQTQKSKKYMPIVLYGKEYWNEVINFEALHRWGMISKDDLKLFQIFDNVDETFNYLKKEMTNHYMKPRPKHKTTRRKK